MKKLWFRKPLGSFSHTVVWPAFYFNGEDELAGSVFTALYYYFWSHLPSSLFLLLPRLGLAVIWSFSTWCPARWWLPCFLLIHCHCPPALCLPASPVFPRSQPHPAALHPNETLRDWSQPPLRHRVHTFSWLSSRLLLPWRWVHATSFYFYYMPLPRHGNLGTKWKMNIPGDYN